ncbi:MAB_1171c family putative transporter [Salinispora arenicola]|uniref:MAB_1171c family putative transporter n=1 Tax=Salinispora arenicola TaxID=168697 RepID=UPI0004B9C226|nr:MAB_1171c family putative transporter [Salinispora arenicola]
MTEVKGVLFPVLAGLCFVALMVEARARVRARRDPAVGALRVAFTAKGMAFVLATPAVAAAVDRHSGIPDLGALVIHLAGGVVFSAAVLGAVAFWAHPSAKARQRVRWHAGIALLVGISMVSLWVLAALESDQRADHYLVQGADRPIVDVYLLLYVGGLLVALAEIARICLRYARIAGDSWLRIGLYSTALGAMIYSVNFINRAAGIIFVRLGLDPLRWELVVVLGLAVGMPLIIGGLTVPAWGPYLSAARSWIRDWRIYRSLYAIWFPLYQLIPAIALHAPGTSYGDLNYRLCRRTVEIWDGMLLLRAYRDSRVAEYAARQAAAAGLPTDEQRVIVEAAGFKAALHAKQRGRMPPQSEVEPDTSRRGDDIISEARWLARVAKAYQASPIVAAAVALADSLVDETIPDSRTGAG